jgi:hypothetical protein
MLHACLCTICFVFCYTSWRFYAFSRTNLLTRCHSASSLFSAVLCLRKVTREIFSELDKTKAKFPIFPDTRRSPKQRRKGARGWPHPHGAGHPLVHLLTSPFRLYILLDEKTYCKPPPLSARDREGLEALPGTLPKRGITSGGLLHHHACLRSDV